MVGALMAKRVRRAPAVSENKDFRARESFDNDLEAMLKLVGTRTYDVSSISAGGKQTFTVSVPGCRADEGQTVQVGVPSSFNASLVPWGFVSADDVVTVVLYNPTGSPIDPGSATYSARVMP